MKLPGHRVSLLNLFLDADFGWHDVAAAYRQ